MYIYVYICVCIYIYICIYMYIYVYIYCFELRSKRNTLPKFFMCLYPTKFEYLYTNRQNKDSHMQREDDKKYFIFS